MALNTWLNCANCNIPAHTIKEQQYPGLNHLPKEFGNAAVAPDARDRLFPPQTLNGLIELGTRKKIPRLYCDSIAKYQPNKQSPPPIQGQASIRKAGLQYCLECLET